MAPLALTEIRKSFRQTEILRGIDLTVPDGQFVALVGPSGCGKSTLLRMIAGLESVTGGEIRIGDRVVNRLGPRARNIAMVFQSYALYPHLTVEKNLAFALDLQRMAKPMIAERVAQAAAILGLDGLLERFPRELSGGQRQRVAMGRAIVRDPDLFLFDEPLSNLDAKLRVRMRSEIKALHQRLGKTTVYVTHDQVEAMTMADTIVVMRDGAVEQIGAPLDLYDQPANMFVAGFLGSPAMNFLTATVGHEPGTVTLSGHELSLPGPIGLPAGAPVTLGLRPEKLVPASDVQGLPLSVELVEPTGSETLVQGRLAGQPVTAVLRERMALAPGDTIPVRPAPGALHLFDPATEARLEVPG